MFNFVAMQTLVHHLRIMHRRRGHHDGVYPSLKITTHMRFETKVPRRSLLGRTHLRIPGLIPVLGRSRGREDGGIHNGPFAQEQPSIRQNDYTTLYEYWCRVVSV